MADQGFGAGMFGLSIAGGLRLPAAHWSRWWTRRYSAGPPAGGGRAGPHVPENWNRRKGQFGKPLDWAGMVGRRGRGRRARTRLRATPGLQPWGERGALALARDARASDADLWQRALPWRVVRRGRSSRLSPLAPRGWLIPNAERSGGPAPRLLADLAAADPGEGGRSGPRRRSAPRWGLGTGPPEWPNDAGPRAAGRTGDQGTGRRFCGPTCGTLRSLSRRIDYLASR